MLDLKEYYKSISLELMSSKNRVRNLILHHGEDGRYKEVVLKNIIKRFLPQHYLIGTGFIVKSNSTSQHAASKQVDLIIYDSTFPVLFREEDFIIITPEAVRAIIEVKTNVQNNDLTSIIKRMNSLGYFVYEGISSHPFRTIFNGIFSYEGYETLNIELVASKVEEAFENIDFSEGNVNVNDYKYFLCNHIALNNNYFIKSWYGDEKIMSLYNIKEMAFTYFIFNLLFTIKGENVEVNPNNWFSHNKELDNVKDIRIIY